MKIIYIKETKETCDIVKRIVVKMKKLLNIVNVENRSGSTIYYLPIFKGSKIFKRSIKRLSFKINNLLEKHGSNIIVLSEYLENNQLLKNYLYSYNINILDGRYLFKCLTCQVLEYIYIIKDKKMEFRRGFITN